MCCRDLTGGWSNGTARLAAAQVEELYKENLYLSVMVGGQSTPALRGRLVTHLAGPAEAGGAACLLRGEGGVAGLAWTAIDHSCRLHYSVRMEVELVKEDHLCNPTPRDQSSLP